MDTKYNINYIIRDEEFSFEVELRFPTVELRTKIVRQDLESQKLFKELVKNQKGVVAEEQQIANEQIQKYLMANPNTSEKETQLLETAMKLNITMKVTDEDLEEAAKNRTSELEYTLKSLGDMFKIVIKRNKLSKEINDLINSEYKSEFWQNIDLSGIEEVVNSFRTKYKV